MTTCIHCGKAVHTETFGDVTVVVDDETGGDVCGAHVRAYNAFGPEPHVIFAGTATLRCIEGDG